MRYHPGRTHGRTEAQGNTDARTDRPHSTIPHELVQWGINMKYLALSTFSTIYQYHISFTIKNGFVAEIYRQTKAEMLITFHLDWITLVI